MTGETNDVVRVDRLEDRHGIEGCLQQLASRLLIFL